MRFVCSATRPLFSLSLIPFFSPFWESASRLIHAVPPQGISPHERHCSLFSLIRIQSGTYLPMAQIYRTLASARSSTTPLTRIGSLSSQRCFNSSALLFKDDGYNSIFEGSERRRKPSSSSQDTFKRQDSGKYGRSSFAGRERSSSSSDDSFEKLDSGKYGRSSYPSRERPSYSSSSSPSSSRSFERPDRSSSSDRYGSQGGGGRGFDRPSHGSGGDRRASGSGSGERTYDSEFSPTRRGGPSQNMDPDRDYLYSPNVVKPAMLNGYRTPFKLYYSKTVVQNRKKYVLLVSKGAIVFRIMEFSFSHICCLLVA